MELNPAMQWERLDLDILLRIGVATLVGLALGLERELRGNDAGLRTHGMIALSAAVMTVSVLLLYYQLGAAESSLDPLRVIEGMGAAIGIIAAGLIIVKGGEIRNLTSAAYIWLTAMLGIASGAGQYPLVVIGAGLAFVLIAVLRGVERFMPPNDDGKKG